MIFDEIVASVQEQRPEMKVEPRSDGCSIWLSNGIEPAKRLLRVSRTADGKSVTMKLSISSTLEGRDVLRKFDGTVAEFLSIVDAEQALSSSKAVVERRPEVTEPKVTGKSLNQTAFQADIESLYKTPPTGAVENWMPRLHRHLIATRGASAAQLRDKDFLKNLFDSENVSATGMCTIRVAPAIDDEEFVAWFSENASRPLPSDPNEATARLIELHDELAARFRKLCGKRPLLKINRALCALFPDFFTTLADEGKLTELYRALGGKGRAHAVQMHEAIRGMIRAIVGPAEPGTMDSVKQMCLSWFLYERINGEKEPVIAQSEAVREGALVPVPAVLRRKGLTAIKGYFQTLLGYLPALSGDGLSDEDFRDLIRESNPALVDNSIRTVINVVMREFDLCKRNGSVYQLSARGINVLDSQDPQELADQLLTKVLGVDYVIRTLAAGSKSKAELIAILQTVNPGWTTGFAPSALLAWLMSLQVISYEPANGYTLTDEGRQWDDLITWDPPTLPKVAETVIEIQEEVDAKLILPDWATLQSRLAEAAADNFRWDKGLIEQLHGGLWFHPVRHFAVMAGLSGSGKTQLALNYALALCGPQRAGQESVKVFPIQPGWFDTGPLLGQMNTLLQNVYDGTPFLELLLRAAENPTSPYVAVLDEMNLSHPEQYLAPILSAMETQGVIDLHQMDEDVVGVPSQIRYPANLAIIGTVNMDETTHGLSDKVLDRAYTLEFWKIDPENYPKWSNLASEELRNKVKGVLGKLMDALEPVRLHFGLRTIDDVVSYLVFTQRLGVDSNKALDDVLYAKVLPKLRGEHSDRLARAMSQALAICQEHGLARCATKIQDMLRDLNEAGSTRFWR